MASSEIKPQVRAIPAPLACPVSHVRDEEAAGSNPATPTQVKGHSPLWDVAFFYAVQQQSTYEPSCLPSRLSALSVLASETSV